MSDLLTNRAGRLKELICTADENGLDCPYSESDVDLVLENNQSSERKIAVLSFLFDIVFDLIVRNLRK